MILQVHSNNTAKLTLTGTYSVGRVLVLGSFVQETICVDFEPPHQILRLGMPHWVNVGLPGCLSVMTPVPKRYTLVVTYIILTFLRPNWLRRWLAENAALLENSQHL